jgi:hypothetical protein
MQDSEHDETDNDKGGEKIDRNPFGKWSDDIESWRSFCWEDKHPIKKPVVGVGLNEILICLVLLHIGNKKRL